MRTWVASVDRFDDMTWRPMSNIVQLAVSHLWMEHRAIGHIGRRLDKMSQAQKSRVLMLDCRGRTVHSGRLARHAPQDRETTIGPGVMSPTDEQILGTPSGRQGSSTVATRPEGQRWSKKCSTQSLFLSGLVAAMCLENAQHQVCTPTLLTPSLKATVPVRT